MNKKKPNILIFTPHLSKSGGVATFYKSIKPHFKNEFKFFTRGNKSEKLKSIAIVFYILDYLKFLFVLLTNQIDFFVINTSFGRAGCYRDAIFIKLISLFNKNRFVVFFHGWDKKYESKIDRNENFKDFPINQFFYATGIIVLASEFKLKLESWNYKNRIYLGKTFVEESLVKGYLNNLDKFNSPETFNFLFLSRIEKTKGIIEAIEIFDLIQKANPSRKFNLRIAGNGSFLNNLKNLITLRGIQNIEFLNHIEGLDKRKAFEASHFFLFPSYTEGMPLAVIEAMAFGLPMMVTAVGGLNDIFKDGEMGILLKDLNIEEAFHAVNNLVNDEKRLRYISNFNFQYANKNFLSSIVANELEILINDLFEQP
jgi:glycosyltransferase involved in cell wall biosynthesis